MTNSIYELTIVPMLHSLNSLDAIVTLAEEYVAADDTMNPETLVQARLFPNMLPLVFQIRVATDVAKGAAARLSGSEIPSWADDESTFEEIHQRLAKAIEFLSGFNAEDFEGGLERTIHLQLGPEKATFSGTDYIRNFVLPNFYFHVTTAYNLLRHNGVAIGKRDFLGILH